MQFKNVVGQEGVKQKLLSGLKEKKIAHAYLFSGNTGFGSLALALAFVQFLFCENKGEDESCGECSSCRKIKDLQHPDLHFSFPVVLGIAKTSDSFLKEWREQLKETPYFSLFDWTRRIDQKERPPAIGVDESKEIIKKLFLKSYEGGHKAMLIWLPEEMNILSANKLLKILEEPPHKTIFILVSEKPDKLLPTIISRTQVIRIPKMTAPDISNYLKRNYTNGKANTEEVAILSNGNLHEAVTLMEGAEHLAENKDLFIKMMRVCYKKDVLLMLDWAEEISSLGKDRQKQFLEYSLNMFRQSILKNYVGDQLVKGSNEEKEFLKNFSRFVSGKNVNDFMLNFNEAHYAVERNANAKILFTNLCFKVMRYIHFA
jgi:DNA polymerase-3 subunit delta'